MQYNIECKIETLIRNAIMDGPEPSSFVIDDMKFSHWNFNHQQGWIDDSWLAKATIEAPNFKEAYKNFMDKIVRIVPRVALIGQCYIDYYTQPFVIQKSDDPIAFFRYVENHKAVGLMFMEGEVKALKKLLGDTGIPESFYYYWNDAVNTVGYSSKLLVMFSAIEALVKDTDGKKDWNKLNNILGEELVKDLWGTSENPKTGLRHRLVHGEYFNPGDNGKDYLKLVHDKIINYFNKQILKEDLLNENVTHPQRHFFGNKAESRTFIKAKVSGYPMDLKSLLLDNDKNGIHKLEHYEHVFDDKLNTKY